MTRRVYSGKPAYKVVDGLQAEELQVILNNPTAAIGPRPHEIVSILPGGTAQVSHYVPSRVGRDSRKKVEEVTTYTVVFRYWEENDGLEDTDSAISSDSEGQRVVGRGEA